MPLGHSLCPVDKNNPSFELHPCGHKVCQEHYLEANSDSTSCGHCGELVLKVTELKQKTPTIGPIHPRDTTWSVSAHRSAATPSLVMQRSNGGSNNGGSNNGGMYNGGSNNGRSNNGGAYTGGSNNGGSNNGGSHNGGYNNGGSHNGASNDMNGYGNFPNRNAAPTTPTPGPRHGMMSMNSIIAPPRYVPPMFRGQPQSEVRPESSMSNATFASQVPMTPTNFDIGNGGTYQLASGGYTSSNGRSAYGTAALNPRMAQLDVFGGAPPRMQPNMNGNSTMRPTSTYTNGFGNGSIMRITDHSPSSESTRDLTVANFRAQGAEGLAALIRSGAADDPLDIDYGNPGPSRRAPVHTPLAPATPMERGQIARGAGQNNGITSPGSVSSQETNIDGNAVSFVHVVDVELPSWFSHITMGFKPTVEQVMAVFPLFEACRVPMPSTAGVIKVANIPYNTSRSEITAFLGRNAQIIPQPPGSAYHAVHILMERQSGKTLDAFIELENHKEAVVIVNQFRRRVQQGRTAKIGDRSVSVQLSSQQELMSEMFPRAKNVSWRGAVPKIDTRKEYYYEGTPSSGFIGFLQDEEIVHISKHAETPQRSPFAQRCLIRTYENLISTIYKYPWYALDHVLVHERHNFFEATKVSICALINHLIKNPGYQNDHTKPTGDTLKELTVAALTCPGFTESQKSVIVTMLKQGGFEQYTEPRNMSVRFGGTETYSDIWPFQALLKHPGAPGELVKYLFSLFHVATGDAKFSLPNTYSEHATATSGAQFATIDAQYGRATTIAEVGRAELRGVEAMLRAVLPSAGSTPASRNGSRAS